MGPGGQSSEEEKCCNDIFTTVSYQTFPQLMVFFNLLMEMGGGKTSVLSKTEISTSFHSLASSDSLWNKLYGNIQILVVLILGSEKICQRGPLPAEIPKEI